MSFWQKILLLVLVPLGFEILFVTILAGQLQHAQQESDRYEQSKEVMLLMNKAQLRIIRTITRITLTGPGYPTSFAGFDEALAEVRQINGQIRKTAEMRPELKEVVIPTADLLDATVPVALKVRQNFLNHMPWLDQLAEMKKALIPVLFDFEECQKNIIEAERKIKAEAPKQLEQIRFTVTALLVGGIAFSIAISFASAWLFVTDILKRLDLLEENSRLLAMRQPLKDVNAGNDELAELNTALRDASGVLEDARRKELAVLDVATDVICSIDKKFRLQDVNAASLSAWGYEPDAMRRLSVLTLQTKESEATFKSELERAFSTQQNVEFEAGFVCKDGTIKDFLWTVVWSEDSQSFYCVVHDISERRAAERMKQRFVAIASHDLRTPLSSISANLAVMLTKANNLPPEATKALSKAEGSLERLMDLIRDLLDLEKLEAGKVNLDLAAVSMLDVCNAACDSVEFLAKSLSVNLVRPTRDELALGDERALVRVLVNLVSNAIKFSPRQSTVTVSLRVVENFIEIGVQDAGPGIPIEDQKLIFEKFQQSKTANTTAVKGTGLGLAIAKLIVEAHNGLIGIESEVGRGSRFYFRVPKFDSGADEA